MTPEQMRRRAAHIKYGIYTIPLRRHREARRRFWLMVISLAFLGVAGVVAWLRAHGGVP